MLGGEFAVYFNVKTSGAYSYHCPLKVKMQFLYTPFPCNKNLHTDLYVDVAIIDPRHM
jgi:hypothetical protein